MNLINYIWKRIKRCKPLWRFVREDVIKPTLRDAVEERLGRTQKKHSIFDLRETLLLVKKWLEKLDTKADFWYLDDYNSTEYFDMVISVFAFSEINKDVQDLYLDKVIKRSHHGFMVFNDQWVGLPVYSAHEIAARIPGARSVPYQAFGLEKRFQAHAVIW